MASFTDKWPVLFYGSHPLHGRVKFLTADSSEYKTVYLDTAKETACENPAYTGMDGRLEHQVFLDYGIYTVVLERFVGADYSNYADYKDDPEYWEAYHVFKLDGGTDPATQLQTNDNFVDNIKELRKLNPEQVPYVTVLGYYDRDDGIAPRTYVWNSDSDKNEDYGSFIKSSVTSIGCWEWCAEPILSSDVYGILSGRSDRSELTTKFASLAARSASPDISQVALRAGTYNLNSGSLGIAKPVISGGDLQFATDDGTLYVFFKSYEHGYQNIPVEGDRCEFRTESDVRTSWLRRPSAEFGGTFIVDNDHRFSVSDKDVRIIVAPASASSMTNCRVESNHKIYNSIDLYDMEPHDSWFAEDYDYAKLRLSGCRILLDNFDNADTYVALKNKVGEHDYGDFEERVLNGATIYPGGTLENAGGAVRLAATSGAFEFHNFGGTLLSGLSAVHTLNLVDSWITLSADSTCGGLQVRRGSLAGGKITSIGPTLIDNCELHSAIDCKAAPTTEIRNSKIYNAVECRDLVFANNDVYYEGGVTQYDNNLKITANVTGNNFYAGAHNMVGSVNEGKRTTVNAVWVGNYSVGELVQFDRNKFWANDGLHTYVYSNNTGSCVQEDVNQDIRCRMTMGAAEGARDEIGTGTTGAWAASNITWEFVEDHTPHWHVKMKDLDKCSSIGTLKFFSIGTLGITFTGSIELRRKISDTAAYSWFPVIGSRGCATTDWTVLNTYYSDTASSCASPSLFGNTGDYSWRFNGWDDAKQLLTNSVTLGAWDVNDLDNKYVTLHVNLKRCK